MNKVYITPEGTDINLFISFHKEIWIENEYNRFGINVRDGDVVFDCGASIGLFTNYALVRGASKVISIEYLEDTYNCLVKNIDQPNKVTAINGAVSDRDGSKPYQREDLMHYSFDRLMRENNIDFVDFAKVDIENWEYPLILNMPDETMRKVDRWAIEVHSLSIPARLTKVLEIIEKFSKNGFVCNYEHIHKKNTIAMLYAKKNDTQIKI